MWSPGLIFPEDSRWLCDMPEEPDFPDPLPVPSVTLGGVPPLECCASDGNPVKASSPPATRATVHTCVVFIAASLVEMMKFHWMGKHLQKTDPLRSRGKGTCINRVVRMARNCICPTGASVPRNSLRLPGPKTPCLMEGQTIQGRKPPVTGIFEMEKPSRTGCAREAHDLS